MSSEGGVWDRKWEGLGVCGTLDGVGAARFGPDQHQHRCRYGNARRALTANKGLSWLRCDACCQLDTGTHLQGGSHVTKPS